MNSSVRSEDSASGAYDYSLEWRFNSVDPPSAVSSRLQFLNFVYGNHSTRVNGPDLELVYSELVGNAMKHAPGLVRVAAHVAASGHVTLDVCDTGPEFSLVSSLPNDPFSTTGRGLYITAQLCDQLALTRSAAGNRISARLHLVTEPPFSFKPSFREIPFHLVARFRCLVRR